MDYLDVLDYEQMDPQARESIDKVKARLGKIPNLYSVMAHSPAALKAFMAFHAGLAEGVLTSRETEAVALTIAQSTDCLYCIAAHTVIAKMSKMSEEEIIDIRMGRSRDPKLDVLVKLARDIFKNQGHPHKESVDAFLAAGYPQAALVEVIAQVALNIFTGYLNKTARTPVDYPQVKKLPSRE